MSTSRVPIRAWRSVRPRAQTLPSGPATIRHFGADSPRVLEGTEQNATSHAQGGKQRRALAHYNWASAFTGAGVVFAAGLLWYTLWLDQTDGSSLELGDPRDFIQSGADSFRPTLREITPGPTDEVIRALKEVADQPAAWVPGGREYVNKCFGRLQEIRQTHEMEVNNIARDTYEELRVVANKKGASSLDRVNETWYILSRRMDQLSSLAGDQAQQIIDQHPELKEELNGSLDKLRRLGDHLGPGAKKQVDETFKQMSDIVKQGVTIDTSEQLKKLVQKLTRELTWRRERAWQTAEEQIEPLLLRNPHVKEIVDQIVEVLHQGRAKDVVDKVRQAVLSGSIGELERYIQSLKRKQQEFSSRGLSEWLSRAQDGSRILQNLQQLKEAADTHDPKAEQLARISLREAAEVLDQRAAQTTQFQNSNDRKGIF
ncbi:hypothetical protein HII31_05017 [Pseudocercospora fuligena]|uniref:Uncharacterized protein n=1 Tax=Pseudocercospora fuligena TaxID=685502 RepID=A0A8H6RP46_9PEZI|nr:hypothetical protein HII31_05017 [Pseudocercospora fuligena]